MRVALFSDINTWIGEGEVDAPSPPQTLVDKNDGWKTYSNLDQQGGTSFLEAHSEFAAAYVRNDSVCIDPVDVTNVKLLPEPISI